MTSHDAPLVVQYSTVHFPPQVFRVSDIVEAAADFKSGEDITLKVRYVGMARNPDGDWIAVVHLTDHGNFAVDPRELHHATA